MQVAKQVAPFCSAAWAMILAVFHLILVHSGPRPYARPRAPIPAGDTDTVTTVHRIKSALALLLLPSDHDFISSCTFLLWEPPFVFSLCLSSPILFLSTPKKNNKKQ